MYIYRKQQQFLRDWYRQYPRKPLVIRGARQVGKSTLVRQFAKDDGIVLAEINLDEHKTTIRSAFESSNTNSMIEVCCRISGVELEHGSHPTLLFLDEIQAVPAALTALRYFYEKHPNLAVVVAGSVLEFTLGDPSYSTPVGRVSYLFIPPLTFREFLEATERKDLSDTMRCVDPMHPETLTYAMHRDYLQNVRKFLAIGGMPEVTASFVDVSRAQDKSKHQQLTMAQKLQLDLLQSYRDDIQKYPSTAHIRDVVRLVFDRMAEHVGQKVKYSRLAPDTSSRDSKKALQLLLDAGLCHGVCHTDATGIPLKAQSDPNVRKLYFLDVGLYLSSLGLTGPGSSPRQMLELDDARLVNEGPLAEQFVAGELFARGDGGTRQHLYYWLRERRAENAEVDFVIQHGRLVVPIEIKAGPTGQMKSLWEFCKARHPTIAVRFDAGMPSVSNQTIAGEKKPTQVKLLTLPFYLAGEIDRVLETVPNSIARCTTLCRNSNG